ncbi:MIP/aquaporin family protein [Blastococcus saxobsidens]|uniref:Glycerol uptake facilitator protein n=1 Tax=Blastococcus saxobsidens TaxID=138336 RepID=A0A4Q7YDB1_9ACTN|nr:MIP/aquaporin family protein [Blastococcus saxobsidens]RZU34225.1 glycerol uptake facilitator protein [Blastococcus saxobsidens]
MSGSLGRRCAAELVGTALLVVFGPGSVVAALTVGGGELDYAGLGMIALSFGLVVALVIYAFGSTSGAHINPAVTVVLAVTRRFPWTDVGPYVVAQLLGALVGALLLVGAFGTGAVDLGNIGGVAFGDGVGYGQAILAEALATFLLMLTIMALAVDRRAPGGWAGWLIGLSVTGLVLVFAPLTGAAVNPARALGPNAVAAIFGGDVAWTQFPAYVVGSLLGALAAAVLYEVLARPGAAEPEEPEVQGTQGEVTGSRG